MKPAGLIALIATMALATGCNSANQANSIDPAGGLQPSNSPEASSEERLTQQSNNLQQPKIGEPAVTTAKAPAATPATSFAAITQPSSSSTLKSTGSKLVSNITPSSGRSNPFAPAEQPEFEVRYLPPATPAAVKQLPPVPQVGQNSSVVNNSLIPLTADPNAVALAPTVSGTTAASTTVPVSAAVPARDASAPATIAPTTTAIAPPAASPSNPEQTSSTTDLAINPEGNPRLLGPTASTSAASSPTALAEALEITGVVQIGDQLSVIIKDSGSTLSRTVTTGARLAGGEVELRRIDTTTQEPHVVLEQNGVEIIRAIGV